MQGVMSIKTLDNWYHTLPLLVDGGSSRIADTRLIDERWLEENPWCHPECLSRQHPYYLCGQLHHRHPAIVTEKHGWWRHHTHPEWDRLVSSHRSYGWPYIITELCNFLCEVLSPCPQLPVGFYHVITKIVHVYEKIFFLPNSRGLRFRNSYCQIIQGGFEARVTFVVCCHSFWDIFRIVAREKPSTDIHHMRAMKIIKFIAYVLILLFVLVFAVIQKVSLMLLVSGSNKQFANSPVRTFSKFIN